MDSTENDGWLKTALSKRSARSLSVVALLALVPVVAFAFANSVAAGLVTSVNVVLIFVSVYLLLSPTDAERDHEDGDAIDSAV